MNEQISQGGTVQWDRKFLLAVFRKEGTDQCSRHKQSTLRWKHGTDEDGGEADGIFRYDSSPKSHKKNEVEGWMKWIGTSQQRLSLTQQFEGDNRIMEEFVS